MIETLKTISSTSTIPYENMALEAYLLHHVNPGECILYLWQNQHTVVIGRNQNSWKECRIQELENDGGYLARRLSGGGAVFHDLGNLNFTFLMRREDYDVNRQTEVILRAVQMYGIPAERNGRNDIVIKGQKVSGHAFYQNGDFCYHHGTLLLSVNKQKMSMYLNVSKEKLISKGVDSVKSRVTNLTEHNPEVTVEGMKERLKQASSETYGKQTTAIKDEEMNWEEVRGWNQQFASWEWKYGKKIPFQYEMERRYPWGDIQIQIQVNQGRIKEVMFYSDSLEVWILKKLAERLQGTRYQTEAVKEAMAGVDVKDELQRQMKEDISTCICEVI